MADLLSMPSSHAEYRPEARGRDEILAAIELRQAEVAELVRELAGLDGAPQQAPDIATLKEAAGEVGWREERLKAHLVRWLREHPDEPPIGWQAGGRRSCPWIVDLNRLRRYVGLDATQRPTSTTSS